MSRASELAERMKILEDKIAETERQRDALIAEYIPIGARISYSRGKIECHGDVIDVFSDRVRLRGNSGAEYWVDSHRITRIQP